MGKKKARRADRPKKRKFTGNMYTRKQQAGEAGPSSTHTRSESVSQSDSRAHASASKTKLGPQIDIEFDDDDELSGFRFIDVKLLIDFVSTLLCPQCRRPLGENKQQSYVTEDRSSLASKLTFTCQCQHQPSFWTSSKCGRTYEVNRRFPLAMFAIGRNYTQGKRFLGNMNMPTMYKSSWSLHKKAILHATEETADYSTQKAAGELKASKGERVDVSCDGTWQRRGFQSKNGVFTVLSVDKKNSKVIDTIVMSNYCDACAKNEKKRTAEDFREWKQSHAPNCDKNHEGSAGSMEPAGAVTAFRRSDTLHGLKYVSFLGDGDSKSFSAVSKAEPPIYADEDIAKLECCGHVQKRMGRQLTSKVAALKKETYKHNGKTVTGIGGKGGLTKKGILSIQGHYGAAIRNNVGDVQAMKRDIWAIWEHRNKTHTNCGVWCASKKDPPGDPNRNALPPFICKAIKPVFETLSCETLLSKCAHGGTQNTNESFHNLIWERCPKTCFVGRPRLALAVFDATIAYNDGELGRLSIFTKLGMPEGHYTTRCFRELDATRIQAAAARLEPAQRRARRVAAAQIAEGQEEFYQAGAHE